MDVKLSYLPTNSAFPPTRFLRVECFTENRVLIRRSELYSKPCQSKKQAENGDGVRDMFHNNNGNKYKYRFDSRFL